MLCLRGLVYWRGVDVAFIFWFGCVVQVKYVEAALAEIYGDAIEAVQCVSSWQSMQMSVQIFLMLA